VVQSGNPSVLHHSTCIQVGFVHSISLHITASKALLRPVTEKREAYNLGYCSRHSNASGRLRMRCSCTSSHEVPWMGNGLSPPTDRSCDTVLRTTQHPPLNDEHQNPTACSSKAYALDRMLTVMATCTAIVGTQRQLDAQHASKNHPLASRYCGFASLIEIAIRHSQLHPVAWDASWLYMLRS
jgi:hypothetical protein